MFKRGLGTRTLLRFWGQQVTWRSPDVAGTIFLHLTNRSTCLVLLASLQYELLFLLFVCLLISSIVSNKSLPSTFSHLLLPTATYSLISAGSSFLSVLLTISACYNKELLGRAVQKHSSPFLGISRLPEDGHIG